MEKTVVPIQAYSKAEISIIYRISIDTLRNWYKRANIYSDDIKNAKILTAKQVKLTFDTFGYPEIKNYNLLSKVA